MNGVGLIRCVLCCCFVLFCCVRIFGFVVCCVCGEVVLVVVFSRRGLSWDCGVDIVMVG